MTTHLNEVAAPEDRAGDSIAAAAGASDKPAPQPEALETAAARRAFGPPAESSLNVGVIGNCAFSALVDARGRIVWCCLPRFDGEPVFNALLRSAARTAAPGPSRSRTSRAAEQGYEPNTAVLRTRLYDNAGQGVEITDFAPRFHSRRRMFRPLTMVRRVQADPGHAAHARARCAPRFDWGGHGADRSRAAATTSATSAPTSTLRLNTRRAVSHVLSCQTSSCCRRGH